MFSTPAMRKHLKTLQPNYTPPGATTVRKYVKVKYLEEKSRLKSVLSEQAGVGITCDMWTSKASQGYITVTGHYITNDWLLKNCVLATRGVTDQHTGENIHKALKLIEKEFDIEGKIAGLTSDNASNMKSAGGKHKFCFDIQGHVQCFAHTIQLAVGDGLKLEVVKETAAVCRKLVEHFNKSVQASDALEAYQVNLGQKALALCQDVKTRWNSTYLMFQ